jgi:hypothetical protein
MIEEELRALDRGMNQGPLGVEPGEEMLQQDTSASRRAA